MDSSCLPSVKPKNKILRCSLLQNHKLELQDNEGTWVGKSNNNILTSNDHHLCCLQFCKELSY